MEDKVSIRPFNFSKDLFIAIELYESTFPKEERRDTIAWIKSLESGKIIPWTILSNHTFAGFFTLWPLQDFVYGEHFAIHPFLRGQGIGGRALDLILQNIGKKPCIIEVEPETTSSLARRRIKFYQSHGFYLCTKPYLQPPYRDKDKALELRLMSTNEKITLLRFNEVCKEIHRVVYGKTNINH